MRFVYVFCVCCLCERLCFGGWFHPPNVCAHTTFGLNSHAQLQPVVLSTVDQVVVVRFWQLHTRIYCNSSGIRSRLGKSAGIHREIER